MPYSTRRMCGGSSNKGGDQQGGVVMSPAVDRRTVGISPTTTVNRSTATSSSAPTNSIENENRSLETCSTIVGSAPSSTPARCVSNESRSLIFGEESHIRSSFTPAQESQTIIDTDAATDVDDESWNCDDGNEQGGHLNDEQESTSSISSSGDNDNVTARSSKAQSCDSSKTEGSAFGLNTAMIENIAAKAAAAAAAAVFGRRSEVGIEVPSPTYSVQTLDVDTPQRSVASPAVTFPLPIFGAGHSHCNTSGKKRRRSNESTVSSHSMDDGVVGSVKNKRALFLPHKKKKKRSSQGSARTSKNSDSKVTRRTSSHSSLRDTASKTPTNPRPSTPFRISKGSVEVRTVPPTVHGIHEAARILLASTTSNALAYPISPNAELSASIGSDVTRTSVTNEGILSFPTETAYTLTTCITVKPLLRSLSTSSASSTTSASEEDNDGRFPSAVHPWTPTADSQLHSPSLARILHLKGKLLTKSKGSKVPATKAHTKSTRVEDNALSSISSIGKDPDPPLLYIHTPSQSRDFVHFTKPKTFVLKPSDPDLRATSPEVGGREGRQSPKSAQQVPAQVPAVTFSESREVLDRLANAFWPGPVIIFAKCKMRRALRESFLPPIQEDLSLSTMKMTSLERGSSEENEMIYAPILPTSVLQTRAVPAGNVVGSDPIPASPYYVGMRCPSHPLARRVLEEVYLRNRNHQQQPGGRRVRSCVVVGFNARSATWSDCPINAKEVSSQLNGALIETHSRYPEAQTSFIDVLNGEDEREMFAAPTCQFGVGACSSLIIDDDNKTIRIVQPKDESARATPKSKDVIRALRTSPRSAVEIGAQFESGKADAEKVASRVITVVLNRWKVEEETCETVKKCG